MHKPRRPPVGAEIVELHWASGCGGFGKTMFYDDDDNDDDEEHDDEDLFWPLMVTMTMTMKMMMKTFSGR